MAGETIHPALPDGTNPATRFQAKRRLVRLLYERDWDKRHILRLFSVLDWMMQLQNVLDRLTHADCQQIETWIDRVIDATSLDEVFAQH